MYSQDETVEAVLNFYLELTKLTYPDESWLRIPPPEGWDDDSMAQTYQALSDKTDTVKRLLKHLPYLRTEPFGRSKIFGDILIGPDTVALCYSFPPGTYANPPGRRDRLYGLPPHCLYLTDGDRESIGLVLDAEAGTITETAVFASGLPRYTVSHEEYDNIPLEDKWKAFPTTPVREFFEKWTRLYIKLIWMIAPAPMPVNGPDVGRFHDRVTKLNEDRQLVDADWSADEWNPDVHSLPPHVAMHRVRAAAVYNAHLRHGWPANLDKVGCRQALLALESSFAEEDRREMDEASREIGEEVYHPPIFSERPRSPQRPRNS